MELADLLIKARREGRTIMRPSHHFREFDLNDGYEVYAAVDQILRAQGLKPAGRKLGFTNKATWKEFHLDTPIWAHIYTETLIETKGSEIFGEKGKLLKDFEGSIYRIEINTLKELTTIVLGAESLQNIRWEQVGNEAKSWMLFDKEGKKSENM